MKFRIVLLFKIVPLLEKNTCN